MRLAVRSPASSPSRVERRLAAATKGDVAVEHIEGWLHDVSAALEREQESINSSRAQQVARPRGGRANSAAEQQQEEDEHVLHATAARVLSQSQAELLAQQERLQVRATIDR